MKDFCKAPFMLLVIVGLALIRGFFQAPVSLSVRGAYKGFFKVPLRLSRKSLQFLLRLLEGCLFGLLEGSCNLRLSARVLKVPLSLSLSLRFYGFLLSVC